MTEERWLPVPGYEGRYSVSDHGRVRSEVRPGRKQQIILAGGSNLFGHRQVVLSDGTSTRTFGVHRLVLAAFVGPCPEGQEVRHYPDHDPTNNHLSNLRYGTRAQNIQDMKQMGRCLNSNKDECVAGHLFSEKNTYIDPSGKRQCRECNKRRAREYRERRADR